MQTWPSPPVPRVPGTPRPLRLYDTAAREIRPTAPGPTATMYVCGITPYDATHLGHAATYLAFDLVHRQWLDNGHDVHYVQNVTDVDDPLLERARRDQDDWVVLAMRETALFREDMAALRVLPPRDYLGAVESIPEIVEAVAKLLTDGIAYRVGRRAVPGHLLRAPGVRPVRLGVELLAGEMADATSPSAAATRTAPASGTRSTRCCGVRRGRTSRAGRASWGPGRPGWHVECSVIALNRLGMGFDVQGGGSDLIFPHHEFSAAHAEALTGEHPFARHYAHAGMIGLDGEKMSKSRGNLVFVSRLRADKVDPMAVRLGLLSGHYRSDRPWTAEVLSRREARLARWRAAVALAAAPPAEDLVTRLRDHLSNDLDTPKALAAVDAWAEEALTAGGADTEAPALVRDGGGRPARGCALSRSRGSCEGRA